MPQALRKLRRQLRATIGPEVEVALFRVADPAIVGSIMAAMMGAASVGAMSAVAGTAIDIILKPFAPTEQARRKWPHRVIIVVEPADVTIYASNRHGIQGGKLVRFQAGEFKADLDHYPGEIDLTFESLEGKSYWVRGSWGPIRRSCSRAAHAAIRLSSGSAQPEIGVHESERRRHPEMP